MRVTFLSSLFYFVAARTNCFPKTVGLNEIYVKHVNICPYSCRDPTSKICQFEYSQLNVTNPWLPGPGCDCKLGFYRDDRYWQREYAPCVKWNVCDSAGRARFWNILRHQAS